MLNLATVVHVPALVHPTLGGLAQAFLNNLKRWKMRHRLIVYSAYPYTAEQLPEGASFIKLKCAPEKLAGVHENPLCGANNAAWVAGMKMVVSLGVSHVIYLEADCRMGQHGWDEVIFNEYFSLPFPPIAAGSMVCFDMNSDGLATYKLWQEWVCRQRNSAMPILSYGNVPSKERSPRPMLFPNGALGVYDVHWIKVLFDLSNMIKIALGKPWDYQIGGVIWERFGRKSFDVQAHLNTIWSTYGDGLSTEQDRLKMLTDGAVVAVHQVKNPI